MVRYFLIGVLVLMGLMAGGLMILSGFSGNGAYQKKVTENLLSNFAGMTVEIETLNRISVFPELELNAENLSFYKSKAKEGGGADITVESIIFKMTFWDLVVQSQDLKALDIQNVKAKPGALIDGAFRLDSLGFEEKGQEGPVPLTASGMLGDAPFELSLQAHYNGQSELYAIDEPTRFVLKLARIVLNGQIEKTLTGLEFSDLNFKSDDIENVLSGDLSLRFSGADGRSFEGALTLGRSPFDLNIDERSGEKQSDIKGEIKFKELFLSDLLPGGALERLIEAQAVLSRLQSGAEEGGQTGPVNLKIEIASLKTDEDANLGSLSFDIDVRGDVVKLDGLKGDVFSGEPAGTVVYDMSQSPAAITVDLELKAFDHGRLQELFLGESRVSGRADFKTSLVTNDEQPLRALTGQASLIAGEGDLNARILNLWGGGLLNALLPSFSPEEELALECAIADFDIEQGVAKTNALFVNTKRVRVVGDGSINFYENKIDLTLKPESRDIALIDVGTDVRITGDLTAPSVSPSGLSILKKIGKLALGTVNPAFLAYSLTDLGLGGGHPCADYISAEPVPEAPAEPQPANGGQAQE